VHTPEIEPVTNPFVPRWNRRGRSAPAKAACFCGPVRFGATSGHVCIKFCLVCNGKLSLTNKKPETKMINVFVPAAIYRRYKFGRPDRSIINQSTSFPGYPQFQSWNYPRPAFARHED
jgi:hypothetical protein